MNSKIRWLGGILSILLIAWSISYLSNYEIDIELNTIAFHWFVPAILLIFINFFAAAQRYRLLVAPHLPYRTLLEIHSASFLLNYGAFVPGLGAGLRASLLKLQNIPLRTSAAALGGEVFFDLFFCTSVSLVIALTYYAPMANTLLTKYLSIELMLVGTCVLVLVIGLALYYLRKRKLLSISPERPLRQSIAIGLALTAIVWFSTGLALTSLLKAFSPTIQAELAAGVLAVTAGFLSGLASMLPGGIGVREITWTFITSQSGYPVVQATAAAICLRAITIFVGAVILLCSRLFKAFLAH